MLCWRSSGATSSAGYIKLLKELALSDIFMDILKCVLYGILFTFILQSHFSSFMALQPYVP